MQTALQTSKGVSMNKLIKLLTVFAIGFSLSCAQTVRQDEMILGRPASTSDKVLTFDTGDGASNYKLTAADASRLVTASDSFTVGDDLIVSDNATVSGEVTVSGTGTHSVSEQFANEVIEEYARPTGTSPGVRGVAISASSGFFSTASPANVTNHSITLVTTGRPVVVGYMPDGSTSECTVKTTGVTSSSSSVLTMDLRFERGGSRIGEFKVASFIANTTQRSGIEACSSINMIDTPGAGTHTYTSEVINCAGSSSQTCQVLYAKLYAYEL